jgi:hypothetical protein
VHKQSFTVYPPGYTPFARKRLVPRHERWEATIFEAALDAADGERWSDTGGQGGRWTTQWRHIARLGELLGLDADGRIAEIVAKALRVDLHVHAKAREKFCSGGFRNRGRAVVQVLEAALAAGAGMLWRLLRAGYMAGLCGRGFWANPRWGLKPMVF